jgi:hypothetical protein
MGLDAAPIRLAGRAADTFAQASIGVGLCMGHTGRTAGWDIGVATPSPVGVNTGRTANGIRQRFHGSEAQLAQHSRIAFPEKAKGPLWTLASGFVCEATNGNLVWSKPGESLARGKQPKNCPQGRGFTRACDIFTSPSWILVGVDHKTK